MWSTAIEAEADYPPAQRLRPDHMHNTDSPWVSPHLSKSITDQLSVSSVHQLFSAPPNNGAWPYTMADDIGFYSPSHTFTPGALDLTVDTALADFDLPSEPSTSTASPISADAPIPGALLNGSPHMFYDSLGQHVTYSDDNVLYHPDDGTMPPQPSDFPGLLSGEPEYFINTAQMSDVGHHDLSHFDQPVVRLTDEIGQEQHLSIPTQQPSVYSKDPEAPSYDSGSPTTTSQTKDAGSATGGGLLKRPRSVSAMANRKRTRLAVSSKPNSSTSDASDGDEKQVTDAESEEEDSDDDGEYSDEYQPSASVSPARSLSPVPMYASLPEGAPLRTLATSRRMGHAPLPVPIPHLTKKSRGRKVPTFTEAVRGRRASGSGREYACDVEGCGKCFKRGEHLKRHVRSIHTHDKPHPCPFCDKTFSRRDNLGQHMRVHGSAR